MFMEYAEDTQKALFTFYGSAGQRKKLDEDMPGIAKNYNVQHITSPGQEPVLRGCGGCAVGWHQIGACFDPEFDPL